MTSASSTVSVVVAPAPPRTGPKPAPALTVRMLVPALLIWFSIEARAPLPIATITMTAATPMIMPSAVSAVRIALRRRARTAIQMVLAMDMVVSYQASGDQGVFVDLG